jgi:hypothetical protein
MVQVGTAKFNADKFCNLTTVTLAGTLRDWDEKFIGDYSSTKKMIEESKWKSPLAKR